MDHVFSVTRVSSATTRLRANPGCHATHAHPPTTCVIRRRARELLYPSDMQPAMKIEPYAAWRELRDLVATYLESSDDARRAHELLAALEPPQSRAVFVTSPTPAQEDRECAMFGCTAATIDEALRDTTGRNKSPRDVAMYAMSVLSDAQELIRRYEVSSVHGTRVEWTVTPRDADTIRRLLNVAKYTIDKAVPR